MNIGFQLAALTVFNFFSVVLGYEGIARLRKFHFPPFHEGLCDISCMLRLPPDSLILWWDSSWGRIIIWSSCLVIPVVAAFLSFAKKRHVSAVLMILFGTALSGVAGLWIWLDAVFNAFPMGG